MHMNMKMATVAICAIVLASARCAAADLPPIPEGAFTHVVIPDTQLYHGEGTHVRKGKPKPTGPTTNPAFKSRVNWIVDHLKSGKT